MLRSTPTTFLSLWIYLLGEASTSLQDITLIAMCDWERGLDTS